MAGPNAEIKIYSDDEALAFLIQHKEILEELMGKKDLFHFPMPAAMLNEHYLNYIHQLSSYFYVGVLEEKGELQAILPLLGASEMPSPPVNRLEFLAMRPTVKMEDVKQLFEKMLQIADDLNIPLRFYLFEFTDPKVKELIKELGFQEKGSLITFMFDLADPPTPPLKETVKLVSIDDPYAWWSLMLLPYGLPAPLTDKIANLFSQREQPVLDVVEKIFHRFLALDANENVVGCIEFWTATPYPLWINLVVKPELRGRGLATSILTAIRDEIKNRNYPKCFADGESKNTPVLRIFEKLGCQAISEEIYFERLRS
ncbi:MAG: GNAT family N-acetyltransferase [Candidatus Hermodarchaeota archaeon]